MEEFAPKKSGHIAGEDNVVADSISRLGMEPLAGDLIKMEKAQSILILVYCNIVHRIEHLYNLKEVIGSTSFSQAPNLIKEVQHEYGVLKGLGVKDHDC